MEERDARLSHCRGSGSRFSSRAPVTQPALVNGEVGILVAPWGELSLVGVITFKPANEAIVEIDLVADRRRLREIELAVLEV